MPALTIFGEFSANVSTFEIKIVVVVVFLFTDVFIISVSDIIVVVDCRNNLPLFPPSKGNWHNFLNYFFIVHILDLSFLNYIF